MRRVTVLTRDEHTFGHDCDSTAITQTGDLILITDQQIDQAYGAGVWGAYTSKDAGPGPHDEISDAYALLRAAIIDAHVRGADIPPSLLTLAGVTEEPS
jgi:hypothetical protein